MKYIGINLHGWGGIGLLLAALAAGALFLSLGIALAVGALALTALALLRSWMRRLWASAPVARGPITIEGECTRSEP